MSTKRESGTPREGIPIEDLLDSHIEQTAAAVAKTDRAIDAEGHVDGQSAPGSRPKTAPIKTGAKRSGSGLFDALSQYFHQHQSSTHSEPLVREQMRSRTLDHINKALVLARQGDAEGAKVHAGLAETAMRTAGDYMSDEEYSQFREQVETRLRAARTPR